MTIANSMPWSYRSVVFDLDGILVDTEPIFEQAAIRLLGRRGLFWHPEVAHLMMGTPAKQAFVYFRDHYQLPESIDELIAESGRDFYDVVGQNPVPLLPGVVELLDRLERKRVPLAIATSSSRRYIGRILEPHGLLSRFQFVLTCEDVSLGKPHPEIYEKAARTLGHVANEMVVIEDSVNGVKAAKAAGARCIAVPHERVQRNGLASADMILDSLTDDKIYMMLHV